MSHKTSWKALARLVNMADDIKQTRALDANSVALAARLFIQATLPHSNPGNAHVYQRHNGHMTMTITPGYDNNGKCYGIPYGSMPRLVLYWLTTEAVRTNSRQIYLGDSLSQFMKDLKLVPTGGRWGSITRLKDQTRRLFRSAISFDYNDNGRDSWINLQITKDGYCWWEKSDQDGYITLNESFYEAITTSAAPVDMRALDALKQSPLALDLYTWLTYRMSYLKQDTFIPWTLLQEQFGQEYTLTKDFAMKAKIALKHIKTVYPELKYDTPRGRLQLKPSPTHIKPLIP